MESEPTEQDNPLNDPAGTAAQAAGIDNPNEVNRLKRFKQWKAEQEANLKKSSNSKKPSNSKKNS